MGKKHIDEVQTSTVDEHFKLILDDRSTIDTKFVEITSKDLPEWFDERLFRTGQVFQQNNLLGFGVVNLAGLLAIFSVPDISDVLTFTKRSSTTCASFGRYIQTLLLLQLLNKSDILETDSKWFKALNTIREKHRLVSERREKLGLHGIYQKDMAITQFGFTGFAFMVPEKVGLTHITPEELMAFHHFWRVTGYLLGISDRMNICRKTVAETTELCRRIANEILAKYMEKPSEEYLQLSSTATNGLWYGDPTINQDAVMYLTYNVTGLKYTKPLSWYSYFNMKQREWLLYISSAPYIGLLIRTICNYLFLTLYWILENYPVGAWIAFGKKNVQVCPYLKY